MMRKYFSWLLRIGMLWVFLAATACTGGQPVSPSANEPADIPIPVQNARALLAEKAGTSAKEVQIVEVHAQAWGDDCLGFPILGEDCAKATIPGYQGRLRNGEIEVEFRTDQSGELIRFVPQAVLAAREVLSRQTGVAVDQIDFSGYEEVEWTDSCLGIPQPQSACTSTIIPGYIIRFLAEGEKYEFHLDEGGQTILQTIP
jgi:hypothetical protein